MSWLSWFDRYGLAEVTKSLDYPAIVNMAPCMEGDGEFGKVALFWSVSMVQVYWAATACPNSFESECLSVFASAMSRMFEEP